MMASEPMSDERLAEIKRYFNGGPYSIWQDIARELLAEVERLRAREETMMASEPMSDTRLWALVEVLAGYTPEHSDYSGYYFCQFCQKERREAPPYNMDIAGWRAWLTHAQDCPVEQARALLAEAGERRR